MRIDFQGVLKGKKLLTDNHINKDTVQVYELEIKGKPRFFLEAPSLVYDPDNWDGKTIDFRLQVSPSGTVSIAIQPAPKKVAKQLETNSAVAFDSKPGLESKADEKDITRINATRANPPGQANPNVVTGDELVKGKKFNRTKKEKKVA